ncbi:hypothetical protein B566_EDAN008941 [Ephemera danica]|nr:hypothetical protein B566_EDAN008941 [Ephemera danica]
MPVRSLGNKKSWSSPVLVRAREKADRKSCEAVCKSPLDVCAVVPKTAPTNTNALLYLFGSNIIEKLDTRKVTKVYLSGMPVGAVCLTTGVYIFHSTESLLALKSLLGRVAVIKTNLPIMPGTA